MTTIRPAAVAGMFYPARPEILRADIVRYLDEAGEGDAGPVPKAIIAPHAGYVYSGPVAASVYARLRPARDTIRRVILLGPCHRVPVRGLGLSGADVFSTPLGDIPVDHTAEALITDLPQVETSPASHREEHSLEVHLPFLQLVLDRFTLVPLTVGWASPDEVAEVLERLWGGPETLIVVSSDLSHFLDYDSARALDARTRTAIEALNPDAIGEEQACGRIPVRGLLALARRRGLSVSTLDIRNSGDTAGDKARVVGYGSWAFVEPATETTKEEDAGDPFARKTRALLDAHGETLVRLAAEAIEHGLETGRPPVIDLSRFPFELTEEGAAFVTLKRKGDLRGCIGSVQPWQPLAKDVAENAYKAAFEDPRFSPLSESELDDLDLSISVLSKAAPIDFADEADLLAKLRPGKDGLIIGDQGRRALFLPQVWEQLPDPKSFLGHLKAKAGLPARHWSDTFRADRFISESISLADLDDPKTIWRRNRH